MGIGDFVIIFHPYNWNQAKEWGTLSPWELSNPCRIKGQIIGTYGPWDSVPGSEFHWSIVPDCWILSQYHPLKHELDHGQIGSCQITENHVFEDKERTRDWKLSILMKDFSRYTESNDIKEHVIEKRIINEKKIRQADYINKYYMKYLYSKSEHYDLFIKENKSNRLSKGLKIMPYESKVSSLLKKTYNINEEIFDKSIVTDYELINVEDGFKKVVFKSNSNTEYRLDIFEIEEDGIVNHISFALNSQKFDVLPKDYGEFQEYEMEYQELTNKNETIEVLNRIHFILRDLVEKTIINNSFCIGGTKLEKKNKIYQYLLKTIVGEGGFKKLNTNIYPEIGWGLYFKI